MIDFVRAVRSRTASLVHLRKGNRAQAEGGRVRYAVVGLGHIAQSAVLPAFANAKRNCELSALVSDTPRKLRELGKQYSVALQCSYDEYDELLESGAVDAVYIALPNSMHRDYTERAAAHGVHVLCEKPMAVTAADCRTMIRAARRNRVKLMIAYRLHFEPANLRAAEIARGSSLGEIRVFNSLFTMQVKAGDVRLDRSLGGGALYDIGIYCINAARMVFRAEPVEVMALAGSGADARFAEVDEIVCATLRYPGDRLATFATSFGAADTSRYELVGTKGRLAVDPAYEIAEKLVHHETVDGRTRERSYRARDQFAPELEYFSDCVLNDRVPEPSGSEGLADVRIIEALRRSIKSKRPVRLSIRGDRQPSMAQARRKPTVGKQRLVAATQPTRD
ncbi:MAG: Gfo/Idh/MocA family oxidoreductase [Gemmatimonadaceae bacterium]